MRLFYDLEQGAATSAPAVFTFGTFDGVHCGHRFIFSNVHEQAKKRGLQTSCLTFSNHPIEFLKPEVPLQQLTAREQKLELLQAANFDYLFFLPFDKALRNLSAQEFIEKIQRIVPFSLLVVGADVSFGRYCEGNQAFIRNGVHSFESLILDRFCIDGVPVSSSRIREAIHQGDFALAEKLLGRPYSILLKEESRYALPPPGSYRVEVRAKAGSDWKKAQAVVSSIQQITLIEYAGEPTEIRFLGNM